MKHELRKLGVYPKPKITNKKLEKIYRRVTRKKPPSYTWARRQARLMREAKK